MPGEHGPIWARPEPGTRRPRFTREQIASAALAIADAEGFEAVSMRRVAAELGAGTMTLYHYVRTKDDLVALMDDALMGAVLVPEESLRAGWRAALSAVARRTWEVLGGHAWALHSLQEAQLGPNAMRHFEQSLAALEGTPLEPEAKLALLAIVDDFVHGAVLRAAEARARFAMEPAAAAAARAWGEEQLHSGRFPHSEALAASGVVPSAEWLDQQFEAGLAMLLDGAASRLGLP
jgi:AcrR family transcriptional regulator